MPWIWAPIVTILKVSAPMHAQSCNIFLFTMYCLILCLSFAPFSRSIYTFAFSDKIIVAVAVAVIRTRRFLLTAARSGRTALMLSRHSSKHMQKLGSRSQDLRVCDELLTMMQHSRTLSLYSIATSSSFTGAHTSLSLQMVSDPASFHYP